MSEQQVPNRRVGDVQEVTVRYGRRAGDAEQTIPIVVNTYAPPAPSNNRNRDKTSFLTIGALMILAYKVVKELNAMATKE
jgi:hypothetical protein